MKGLWATVPLEEPNCKGRGSLGRRHDGTCVWMVVATSVPVVNAIMADMVPVPQLWPWLGACLCLWQKPHPCLWWVPRLWWMPMPKSMVGAVSMEGAVPMVHVVLVPMVDGHTAGLQASVTVPRTQAPLGAAEHHVPCTLVWR